VNDFTTKTTVQIAAAPRGARLADATRAPTRGLPRLLLWLAPLFFLLPIALVFGFIQQGPYWLFGWVFGGLCAVMLGWIAVSVFWPARADRTCPSCAAPGLCRADANTTLGLVCSACGWSDASESGWLLAEEEGPLEGLVLEQRRRTRANQGLVPPARMSDS
jgi:hypothetical protein